MNPADYEDKPDVIPDIIPPEDIEGPPFDVMEDTGDLLISDEGTADTVDASIEDTAVDAVVDGSSDGSSVLQCDCVFTMPATTPTPQSYLWLTGDFLDPPWPGDKEGGAIPMAMDPNTDLWTTSSTLTDGQVVAYKFLAGWPDNSGPVWRTQEGDSTVGAADSILVVSCGQTPCSEVP
jgi:hypothetical protein